jgi:hypothetical protein
LDSTVLWREGTDIEPRPPSWPGAFVHPTLANRNMQAWLAAPGEIVYEFGPDDPEDESVLSTENLAKIGMLISIASSVRSMEIVGQVGLSISLGGRF